MVNTRHLQKLGLVFDNSPGKLTEHKHYFSTQKKATLADRAIVYARNRKLVK